MASEPVACPKVVRKPRISPPGNAVVWMLRYTAPFWIPLASAASADAGVPPFAVMNALFHELARVVS